MIEKEREREKGRRRDIYREGGRDKREKNTNIETKSK
jgi:hypothetical protein